MMTPSDHTTVDQHLSVDLYVRADAPVPERRDAVIDRLERLRDSDRIAGFDVSAWPRAVSMGLSDRMDEEGIPGTVRSFERWASRHGLRIRPPFDVRSFRSAITGEADDLLVLPVLCLAARDDDGLVWVAPVSDGESDVTVEDALDALAAGRPPIPGLSPFGDDTRSEQDGGDSERTDESAAGDPGSDPDADADPDAVVGPSVPTDEAD